MKSQHALLLSILFPLICDAGPPVDPRMGSVTKQDFFLYSCVQEYMKANAVKVFDGSVIYGVEYSTLSSKELNEIYKSAKQFASTIPAPNYSDQEHGLPAVLVACLEESKKLKNKSKNKRTHTF